MKMVVALMKFFGLKPGETLTEFASEVKALTKEDKAEMKPALEKELGETIEG